MWLLRLIIQEHILLTQIDLQFRHIPRPSLKPRPKHTIARECGQCLGDFEVGEVGVSDDVRADGFESGGGVGCGDGEGEVLLGEGELYDEVDGELELGEEDFLGVVCGD